MKVPVPLYALVIEEEKRVAKNGNLFWQVVLKTTVGNLKAFMWNAAVDAESSPKYPHAGDIIEVTSFEDNTAERGNIVISNFGRMTRNDLPVEAQSVLEVESASDQEIKESLALILDSSFWEDEANHQFTLKCLQKVSGEKFKIVPAATKVHHNYQGGLLVHTAEVLALARAVVEACVKRYSFINRDVVYAGAVLHDIGKIKTYYINEIGIAQTLTTEKTIGHLFYGMETVSEVARETNHDQKFVDELLHVIASHHGLPEWGSIKNIQSVEAGIVSRIDYISSRNGMVESVLKESKQTGVALQDEFRIYGDSYFYSTGMQKYVKTDQ